MRTIIWASLALVTLLLSACAAALPGPVAPAVTAPAVPATVPALLPPEPPPSGAEGEFKTDFTRHTVSYADILSGGPPKNGIPVMVAIVQGDKARRWVILILPHCNTSALS